MLKFCAANQETGRPVLGIGLSKENCQRLLEGQPIQFNTTGMEELPDLDVLVFGGETEQEMATLIVEHAAAAEEPEPDEEVN